MTKDLSKRSSCKTSCCHHFGELPIRYGAGCGVFLTKFGTGVRLEFTPHGMRDRDDLLRFT